MFSIAHSTEFVKKIRKILRKRTTLHRNAQREELHTKNGLENQEKQRWQHARTTGFQKKRQTEESSNNSCDTEKQRKHGTYRDKDQFVLRQKRKANRRSENRSPQTPFVQTSTEKDAGQHQARTQDT